MIAGFLSLMMAYLLITIAIENFAFQIILYDYILLYYILFILFPFKLQTTLELSYHTSLMSLPK